MTIRAIRFIAHIQKYVPTGGSFAAYVLIPLVFITVYFGAAAQFLPAGVNKVFATRSLTYAAPPTILLAVVYASALALRKARRGPTAPSGRPFSTPDLFLLLLPLTPITQYLINNSEILAPRDWIAVLLFFLLLASVLVFLVPLLLSQTGASRPLIYLGCAFAFSIANMASLSAQFSWHQWGSLKLQLPILAGVFTLAWLLYEVRLQNVLSLMIVTFFISNSVLQLTSRQTIYTSASSDRTENRLVSLIGSRFPRVTPSIYLLIYDAYVGNETLVEYGIDNHAQEEYLRDLGFKIYPGTYSVGASSLSSMSRALDASLSIRDSPREAVSGDGTVINLLEDLGYDTYGVFPSDFFFRGVVPTYDHSFPPSSFSTGLLIRAILEGEFRFDIDFDIVSRDEYLAEKDGLFSVTPEGARFVYSHSNLPSHSAFNGACFPDAVDRYSQKLAMANLEMRHDVDLVTQTDPEAIVIIAGDHGPYLTKNCSATGQKDAYELSQISRLDIQDRFGSFLAIRWPSAGYEEYDDITILQDLFPTIFAYMFADPRLQGARMEPITLDREAVSGAYVVNGLIVGGSDDGEPLFTGVTNR